MLNFRQTEIKRSNDSEETSIIASLFKALLKKIFGIIFKICSTIIFPNLIRIIKYFDIIKILYKLIQAILIATEFFVLERIVTFTYYSLKFLIS